MEKSNQTIVIEYRSRKEYCHCCEQKLPEAKVSEVREFEVHKGPLLGWTDWKAVVEFKDDLPEIVREYVYESISFYSTNSYENILIENSEFDKVENFILSILATEGRA